MIAYKGYYITMIDDIEENTGGLFCQVYSDKDCNCEVDNFCIHKGENIKQVIKNNIKSLIKERVSNEYH